MTEPDIPAVFALLTALFEDAAGLAAEGQASGRSRAEIRSSREHLRSLIRTAEAQLDRLGD